MKIQLSKLGKRLLGKTAGRQDYGRICGLLTDIHPGNMVFLDFTGILMVNGSWLNAAIAPLFRWSAETQNDLFPVLCRYPSDWLDEIELVALINKQCYPLANSTNIPVESLRLVGPIDESLRDTFFSLTDLKSATGAELARSVPDAGIQPTAWNNRLKELYDMRLLVRRKEGRQQIYSPLAEEVEFDG